MSDEEQERFEDYIELENYISGLQAGHISYPPAGLTPEQLRVYQMAALLRSLAPDAVELRPEFADELEARLLSDIEAEAEFPTQREKDTTWNIQRQPTAPLPILKQEGTKEALVPPRQLIKKVSRRSLLTGGAVAAASLAVGAGAGAGIDHLAEQNHQHIASATHNGSSETSGSADVAISPSIVTTWLLVTTLDTLDTAAIRFSTESVIGYVLRIAATSSRQDTGTIIAVSAACTHKGCIVQWHNNDRLFHCPCHEGLFDASGTFVNITRYSLSLAPLSRFNVKVEQGKVYVEVPALYDMTTTPYQHP